MDPLNLYRTRVRSHQIDLNGAMYHGAYFDIFDDARIETFRRAGYTYHDMRGGGWTLVVRRVACDFHRPALMDDPLQITLVILRLRAASMEVRYTCRRESDILVECISTYVYVDVHGRPIRVPTEVRDVVDAHADSLGYATAG